MLLLNMTKDERQKVKQLTIWCQKYLLKNPPIDLAAEEDRKLKILSDLHLSAFRCAKRIENAPENSAEQLAATEQLFYIEDKINTLSV